MHYTEYDAAGNAITTGSAERAVYYTEREDAALSDSIRLRSEPQAVTVQAQACAGRTHGAAWCRLPATSWSSRRDDGPQVRGAGLEADVRRKTIRFSGAVSGTLVLVTESDDDR